MNTQADNDTGNSTLNNGTESADHDKEVLEAMLSLVRITITSGILMFFALRHSYLMYFAKTTVYVLFNILRFALLKETRPSLGIVFLALGHNGLTLIEGWNTLIYSIGVISTLGQFSILCGIPERYDKYVCGPIAGAFMITLISLFVHYHAKKEGTNQVLRKSMLKLQIEWAVLITAGVVMSLGGSHPLYPALMYVYFITGRAKKRSHLRDTRGDWSVPGRSST